VWGGEGVTQVRTENNDSGKTDLDEKRKEAPLMLIY